MDELFDNQGRQPDGGPQLQIATVTSATAKTARIKLNGMTAAIDKDFRVLQTGVALTVGDRGVAAKISGTYVILGKLSY